MRKNQKIIVAVLITPIVHTTTAGKRVRVYIGLMDNVNSKVKY